MSVFKLADDHPLTKAGLRCVHLVETAERGLRVGDLVFEFPALSTSTVQQPHSPWPQLSRGPPSAKRSRNTSTSVSCGATTHSAAAPFRVKRIVRGAALIVPPATGRLPPGVARGRPPRR